jgi:hypothetical protein
LLLSHAEGYILLLLLLELHYWSSILPVTLRNLAEPQ